MTRGPPTSAWTTRSLVLSERCLVTLQLSFEDSSAAADQWGEAVAPRVDVDGMTRARKRAICPSVGAVGVSDARPTVEVMATTEKRGRRFFYPPKSKVKSDPPGPLGLMSHLWWLVGLQ